MKKKFTALAILILLTLTAFGQTVEEYRKSAETKYSEQNFKGAIKDYNLALKEYDKDIDLYINRGLCYLALKKDCSAMTDFTKVIKIDATYPKAYYYRATIYFAQKRYSKALKDLNNALELDVTIPNALTLRGRTKYELGDKEGAFEDFKTAVQIGDKEAKKLLQEYGAAK